MHSCTSALAREWSILYPQKFIVHAGRHAHRVTKLPAANCLLLICALCKFLLNSSKKFKSFPMSPGYRSSCFHTQGGGLISKNLLSRNILQSFWQVRLYRRGWPTIIQEKKERNKSPSRGSEIWIRSVAGGSKKYDGVLSNSNGSWTRMFWLRQRRVCGFYVQKFPMGRSEGHTH